MNYKDLFHKIISLLSAPGKTWDEIAGGDYHVVLFRFVYPLIGFCTLAEFIGAFLGRDVTPDVFQNALRSSCAVAVALFGGFFVAVYLLGEVEKRWFSLSHPQEKLHAFIGYSFVVTFVIDIVGCFFPIAILLWLLRFYTLFIVFEGARRFLCVPEHRLTLYALVATGVVLASPAVIGYLFNQLSVILN